MITYKKIVAIILARDAPPLVPAMSHPSKYFNERVLLANLYRHDF